MNSSNENEKKDLPERLAEKSTPLTVEAATAQIVRDFHQAKSPIYDETIDLAQRVMTACLPESMKGLQSQMLEQHEEFLKQLLKKFEATWWRRVKHSWRRVKWTARFCRGSIRFLAMSILAAAILKYGPSLIETWRRPEVKVVTREVVPPRLAERLFWKDGWLWIRVAKDSQFRSHPETNRLVKCAPLFSDEFQSQPNP